MKHLRNFRYTLQSLRVTIITSSHHLIISSIFSFLLSPFFLFSQNFDTYFENKTLRIDYLHYTFAHREHIEPKAFWQGGVWSGTRTQLIESERLGDVVFTVRDAKTDEVIYTRSYCTLF